MPAKGTYTNPDGYHLSENRFRKYEAVIQAYMDMFPNEFHYIPANLEPSTMSVQVRGAINGVLLHRYKTNISLERLGEIWPMTTVYYTKEKLVFKCKITIEGISGVGSREVDSIKPKKEYLTITQPTPELLTAACLFLQAKLLTDPILIQNLDFPFTPPTGLTLERIDDTTWGLV